MLSLTIDSTVPDEVLTFGREDEHTTAVVDVDAKKFKSISGDDTKLIVVLSTGGEDVRYIGAETLDRQRECSVGSTVKTVGSVERDVDRIEVEIFELKGDGSAGEDIAVAEIPRRGDT